MSPACVSVGSRAAFPPSYRPRGRPRRPRPDCQGPARPTAYPLSVAGPPAKPAPTRGEGASELQYRRRSDGPQPGRQFHGSTARRGQRPATQRRPEVGHRRAVHREVAESSGRAHLTELARRKDRATHHERVHFRAGALAVLLEASTAAASSLAGK